jgi:hypothetical protein
MAGLLLAGPALGAELPKYDPLAHCRATTAMFGENQKLFLDSCVEQEEKSKAQISSRLGFFSNQTIKQCDTMAAMTAGGSYQTFAGCIAMDVANRFLEGKADLVPVKK